MERTRKLLGVSQLQYNMSSDGIPIIEMRAKFDDGEIPIILPVSQLGTILGTFLGINDFLSEQGLLPDKKQDLIGPVPIHGMGFQAAASPLHTLLVVFLSGCNLACSVPNSELARLGADIGRMATTLSADSTRPN